MNDPNQEARNRVRLYVGGVPYHGWTSVRITAGVERQARDFELGVIARWPATELAKVRQKVRVGDWCQVFIGDDLVLSGWVDATPVEYDDKQIDAGVKGRSRTCDLVDCSAINRPGRWAGQSVLVIAQALAQPYGVAVRDLSGKGAIRVSTFAIEQGETVYEAIDRLLRPWQLFASDNGRGELELLKIGVGRASDRLELGVNIWRGGAQQDAKDRFSEYVVKGQRVADDEVFGGAASEIRADARDTGMGRRRVLMLTQSGDATAATCSERARFERDVRAAKSMEAEYTVVGWRQQDGALWRPNLLVKVVDPLIGFNAELLIVEAEYSLSDEGLLCRLRVGLPDGYRPEPPDLDKARKKDGKTDGVPKGATLVEFPMPTATANAKPQKVTFKPEK
ncbi:phage baseplate assembly protein [Jeongeupia sp. USM3]|uniref:phage baseplate assembly protein n=1 Tax=Jeongeupia sp. USM3 TaxID=1906741 RepID=UPI00089DEA16|nr:hypothetical protein [Jeongeupia sp. USM3]AOY00096.1 hypothetical protein BJP62_06310 [Jeongeupia sp. USM3]